MKKRTKQLIEDMAEELSKVLFEIYGIDNTVEIKGARFDVKRIDGEPFTDIQGTFISGYSEGMNRAFHLFVDYMEET
jgi:hypothetical protein